MINEYEAIGGIKIGGETEELRKFARATLSTTNPT
jgi:hypothetical protein